MQVPKPFRGIQLNKTHPLSRGLVGCWLFNEGTGNKVFDLSGKWNPGTLQGDTVFQPGRFGHCLYFDKTDDYVDCGAGSTLKDLGPLTYSVWINPYSEGEYNHGFIFAKKTSGGGSITNQKSFYIGHTKLLIFHVDYTTTNLERITSDNTLGFNNWYHAAVTWDGSKSASNVHIYINGVEASYKTTTDAVGNVGSDASYNQLIGDYSGSLGCFEGLIDLPMIFNRALKVEEIQQLYREPFRMFESAANLALLSYEVPTEYENPIMLGCNF